MATAFVYTNFTTDGTHVIRTKGSLGTVTVNTPGMGTLSMFDNPSAASGPSVGVIDTTQGGTRSYGCALINGLTVVLAGGGDITITHAS